MAPRGNSQDIVLESLRGGLNVTDPPNGLNYDECTVANNVEFFFSTLGERRKGMQAVDLTGSTLSSENRIVFLTRHFPTFKETDNELWAVAATIGTSVTIAKRSPTTGWTTITPGDPVDPNLPDIYNIQAQSLDNKLFLAYKAVPGVDRLHVWDGTTFRQAGLSQPDAPAVLNEGIGTTYTTVRYFRVRFTEMSGATILRRSEPSTTTTFTPSGTGLGANIHIPALLGEGETHWEVEASLDDANFYIIATLPTSTLTFNDEVQDTGDYANVGELSEQIGTYDPLPAARFLAADDDRLILAGSFQDETLNSRVMWTPVRNDPGVGNFERIPSNTDHFMDLDTYEGGGITAISQAVSGSWYAFKWNHIYKLVRTGNADDAYAAITVSKVRGALPGSVVSGMDEFGRPCIYFLDPRIGPSRIGVSGIQQVGGLRAVWERVNSTEADVVARAVYYPYKQQVWWWIAVDGSKTPNLRLVLQVNELKETANGVSRGWSLADGGSAQALTATVLTETLENEDGHTFLSTRPILGLITPDFIQRGDMGDTDNGTTYIARIRTRPLFTTGLLNRWGAMTAALLAAANGNAQIVVKFIRNFGLETNKVVTDLAPVANEEFVIKSFDNLIMSSAIGIQVEFGDPDPGDTVEGLLGHSEP